MKRTRFAVATVLTAAIVALAGCTGTSGDVEAHDGILVAGFNSPPISLDPLRSANGQGRWYEDPAYASVLSTNNDGAVIAGLADEWGYVGDDNTQFTFTLRDDLVFADGTPLDAQAVVDSFEYFVANGSGPTRAYFLGISAEAVSEVEVALTSASPNPIMDLLLTEDYYAFSPISAAGLADDNARAAQTFGSGPYVLDPDQTVAENKYVYVPNELYHDPEAAKFDLIEIRVIPDAAQLAQALNTGQVDIIQVDPNVAGTLSDDLEVMSRVGAWNGLYITDRAEAVQPALADVRVRQALAFAIDREAVANAAAGEYGEAAVQVALEGDPLWGYDPELEGLYTQDLDRARELLAEAGYPDGFSFTIIYPGAQQADAKLAQALASEFAEIGVTMELKPTADFGAWVNDFVSGQYSGTIFGGAGLPMFLMAQFAWTPSAIMNPYQVSDDEVNVAFAELAGAGAGTDEAVEASQEFTRVVTERALSIPVVKQTLIFAHSPSVGGVEWVGNSGVINGILSWSPAE